MERSSRGPALLYCTLTVVLVLLVAALALSAQPPPPPQIAELTPQAQHQITRAPNQLSSNLGSALGGLGGPGGPAVTTTTRPGQEAPGAAGTVPPPIVEAAVHHCFGNPPRQIEDTQSPPCVSYWAGNNGGGTSRGVTATTITVGVTPWAFSDSNKQRIIADLQSFFNDYFEFYGRRLDLVPLTSSPANGTCASGEAAADGAVESLQPFAFLDNEPGAYPCFGQEAARDHVIEVATTRSFLAERTMAALAPYYWEYPMAIDRQFANMAAFVCAQLAGKRAQFAPDPLLSSQVRKFGLIFQYQDTGYPFDLAPLTDGLSRCGASLAATAVWDSNSSESWQTFDPDAVLAMKQAGVTTVLCYCLAVNAYETGIPAAADSEDYRPEWVLGWTNRANIEVKVEWDAADQRSALIGFNVVPPQVPYSDATLNWALGAVDPGFAMDYSSLYYLYAQRLYWAALLLASGIQMAGPDLTPASFQHGLQVTQFPNPPSPEMEGAVGFGGGSHSMTTDAEVMWWSNTAPSPYPDEGAGAWCYVDGGERFSLGTWSAPMPLFSGPCDSSPPGA